tara:strand:+ start:33481 stop:34881 length:1401 start_codon:yes stop_codon:yes gene_type:complete
MKVKNVIKGIFFSAIIILSSCKKDNPISSIAGCMDSQATNYNASATNDDGSCTYPTDCNGVENGLAAADLCGFCHSSYIYQGMGVLVPINTYADTVGVNGMLILAGTPNDVMNNPGWNATCTGYFFYADGYSTVSYGGQTARLNMASEMMSALASSSTTEAMLDGMFDHQAGSSDFADSDLNASSKQIKSKTATGAETPLTTSEQDYVQALFDGWFADYAANVAPIMDGDENSHPASAGVAGWVGNRELNAKGLEYDQIVAKSLIGALCLDQVVNSYLSPTKLNVDNTTRNPDEDNNATAMEHHWDEGFGYVYGKFGPNNIYGDLSNDGLLGKYLNKFPAWATTVLDAFQAGREAIVAKDDNARDAQAAIIKETLSQLVAQKAVDYLEGAAASVEFLNADYFHGLSEGYGFILSLQFTNDGNGNAYFTHSEVNEMLATLEAGNGLWDRTATELTEMANTISNAAGL